MKKMLVVLVLLVNTLCVSAQLDTPIKVSQSEIKWSGAQLFNLNPHNGTVAFKEGRIQFEGKKLKSGSFVIDMNTIANTDGGYNEGLVDHLKNEDFFEVDKYPTATLTITKVTYDGILDLSLEVAANLTIKGITQPITFSAKVESNDKQMVITSKFVIDRSRWDVKYSSPTFFQNLGNNAISDEIKFEVKIVAEGC